MRFNRDSMRRQSPRKPEHARYSTLSRRSETRAIFPRARIERIYDELVFRVRTVGSIAI